ncbi:MAG: hypothetical protein JCHSAcid_12590 [uncultured Acidilobus sp. JCHS]|jgi:hypothetical protein|nr:MAG: hypothetical protein JCHSAcid_12590 [uncultured Acidilobus sp. JCHS]
MGFESSVSLIAEGEKTMV